MPTPLETISALKQKVEHLEGQVRALNTILGQVALASAFEEPDQLLLPEGMHLGTENPKIIVSITVNGKGIKTESMYPKEAVDQEGWPSVLAQACMAPLGLLARELAEKS